MNAGNPISEQNKDKIIPAVSRKPGLQSPHGKSRAGSTLHTAVRPLKIRLLRVLARKIFCGLLRMIRAR